jgi:serine/threonine protein kinase
MAIDLQVGSGTFGAVFKATDTSTGESVALKRIKIENETQGFPITALREIRILKSLNHENIIKLKEVITYEGNGMFVFKPIIYVLR